jgi:hypothetical protein
VGLPRVERGQFGEDLIEEQHFTVHRGRSNAHGVVEAHTQAGTWTANGTMRARVIHQNPSHHLRRDAKEVRAILPRDAPLAHEPDVRLMDESRRLERVVSTLASEITHGLLAKFSIHQRKQLAPRLDVPASPRAEQVRHPAGTITHTVVHVHRVASGKVNLEAWPFLSQQRTAPS